MLESLIEQEQQETLMRKAMIKQDEQREKAAKRKHKDDLIDDLVIKIKKNENMKVGLGLFF